MIARENTRPSLENTREINTLQNTEKRKKQLEKYTRGKIVRKIEKNIVCKIEEKNSLQNTEKRKKKFEKYTEKNIQFAKCTSGKK